MKIPFNKASAIGNEMQYIQAAMERGELSGDGFFTRKCHGLIQTLLGCPGVLLTHSCTAALEMAAILADIHPGDEVIMPSFTFVSTANAFVLRGGVPVFVDIRPDTMNMDETKIEVAITPKTKAIVPVHYAGVGCEMDTIMDIAQKYKLIVIEDAAQAFLSKYKGKQLGTIGHLATLSFHETKNVIAGEGGALIINDPSFIERAEIIREKGTNRSRFFRGQVDKYSWVDIGSSYLPGELIAAFLAAQLENAYNITLQRKATWASYKRGLSEISTKFSAALPTVPDYCEHNGHLFYLKLADLTKRTQFIAAMKKVDISCAFHYVPLHSSEAGLKYARFYGKDQYTTRESERLVRLPLFYGMADDMVHEVIVQTEKSLKDGTEKAWINEKE